MFIGLVSLGLGFFVVKILSLIRVVLDWVWEISLISD
jgi:hypothetical protein